MPGLPRLLICAFLLYSGIELRAEKREEDPLFTAFKKGEAGVIAFNKAPPEAGRPPDTAYIPRFDANVSADLRAEIRADLTFLQGLRVVLPSPLHKRVFGSEEEGAYSRFLQARIKSVGVGDCGDRPTDRVRAAACIRPEVDASKMVIADIRSFRIQMERVSFFVHEARHTESTRKHWSHVVCPRVRTAVGTSRKEIDAYNRAMQVAGQRSCDDAPDGGYGVQVIMLKNIQKSCAACTEKVKMDAGLYGDIYYGRIATPKARNALHEDLFK